MRIQSLEPDVIKKLRSDIAITCVSQCVEELVWNSIDAGANCIAIRLNLPYYKIQVIDNGSGIYHDQLCIVGKRYATSKCHTLEDLTNLKFNGFKGEAIASLVQISSHLMIETRADGCKETYCKIFKYGKSNQPTKSVNSRPSKGTTVTVFDFMYNRPVRRKAIAEAFDLEAARQKLLSIALVYPAVSFSLQNETTGEICLQFKKCSSIIFAFVQLFGQEKANMLKPIEYSMENYKIEGHISTCAFSSKYYQFLFLNKRLILKTHIHKLICSVLGKILCKKQRSKDDVYLMQSPSKQQSHYCAFVLQLICPRNTYDAVFEPKKSIVQFSEMEKISKLVNDAIIKFLTQENLRSDSPIEENSVNAKTANENPHSKQLCLGIDNFKQALFSNAVKRSKVISEPFLKVSGNSIPESENCSLGLKIDYVQNLQDVNEPDVCPNQNTKAKSSVNAIDSDTLQNITTCNFNAIGLGSVSLKPSVFDELNLEVNNNKTVDNYSLTPTNFAIADSSKVVPLSAPIFPIKSPIMLREPMKSTLSLLEKDGKNSTALSRLKEKYIFVPRNCKTANEDAHDKETRNLNVGNFEAVVIDKKTLVQSNCHKNVVNYQHKNISKATQTSGKGSCKVTSKYEFSKESKLSQLKRLTNAKQNKLCAISQTLNELQNIESEINLIKKKAKISDEIIKTKDTNSLSEINLLRPYTFCELKDDETKSSSTISPLKRFLHFDTPDFIKFKNTKLSSETSDSEKIPIISSIKSDCGKNICVENYSPKLTCYSTGNTLNDMPQDIYRLEKSLDLSNRVEVCNDFFLPKPFPVKENSNLCKDNNVSHSIVQNVSTESAKSYQSINQDVAKTVTKNKIHMMSFNQENLCTDLHVVDDLIHTATSNKFFTSNYSNPNSSEYVAGLFSKNLSRNVNEKNKSVIEVDYFGPCTNVPTKNSNEIKKPDNSTSLNEHFNQQNLEDIVLNRALNFEESSSSMQKNCKLKGEINDSTLEITKLNPVTTENVIAVEIASPNFLLNKYLESVVYVTPKSIIPDTTSKSTENTDDVSSPKNESDNFEFRPNIDLSNVLEIIHENSQSLRQSPPPCNTVAYAIPDEPVVSVKKDSLSSLESKIICTENSRWFCKVEEETNKVVYIDKVTGNSAYYTPEICQGKSVDEHSKLDCVKKKHFFLSHDFSPFLKNTIENEELDSSLQMHLNNFLDCEKQKDIEGKWRNHSQEKSSLANNVQDMFNKWENPMFEIVPEVHGIENSKTSVFLPHMNILCSYRFTKSSLNTVQVIGQVDCKFIACIIRDLNNSSKDTRLLTLFDQHAVHERIRLEELMEDLYVSNSRKERRVLKSRNIATPLSIELESEEIRMLHSHPTHLECLGMKVSFSETEDCVLVHSLPLCLLNHDTNQLRRKVQDTTEIVQKSICEWLGLLIQSRSVPYTLPKTLTAVLNSQACRGAVKFGDPLDFCECEGLLKSLSNCQVPFQCAHGRPSIAPVLDLNKIDIVKKKSPPKLWKLRTYIKEQNPS